MRFRAVAQVIAMAVFVVAVLDQSVSASTDVSGYTRVPVKRAGISLAIPKSWNVCRCSRQAFEQELAHNPDEVAAGLTVEEMMKTFSAKWDRDGDGYIDHKLNIQAFPDTPQLLKVAELRDWLQREPMREFAVKKTRVLGKPAFVVTYVQDGFGSDGAPSESFVETYFFQAKSMVDVAFQRDQRTDPEFDTMTRTMVTSIRALH
jgi:hypothetical protein